MVSVVEVSIKNNYLMGTCAHIMLYNICIIGNTVVQCSRGCRRGSHYHCPLCKQTILRKCHFIQHVAKHTAEPPAKTPACTKKHVRKGKCEVCGDEMLYCNLKRHMTTKHQQKTTGMCQARISTHT